MKEMLSVKEDFTPRNGLSFLAFAFACVLSIRFSQSSEAHVPDRYMNSFGHLPKSSLIFQHPHQSMQI